MPMKANTWHPSKSKHLGRTSFLGALSHFYVVSFSSAWFPLSATRGHSMGLRVFVLPHNGSILPQQQGLPNLLDIGHHCDWGVTWGRSWRHGSVHGCACKVRCVELVFNMTFMSDGKKWNSFYCQKTEKQKQRDGSCRTASDWRGK